MGDALNAVESLYFAAQSSLNDMLAACQDDDQRDAIKTRYIATRQNYWTCINKTFHEDDPGLQSLESDAKTTCDAIKRIDDQLGDIAKVLKILDQAVSVGSEIVKKIITL